MFWGTGEETLWEMGKRMLWEMEEELFWGTRENALGDGRENVLRLGGWTVHGSVFCGRCCRRFVRFRQWDHYCCFWRMRWFFLFLPLLFMEHPGFKVQLLHLERHHCQRCPFLGLISAPSEKAFVCDRDASYCPNFGGKSEGLCSFVVV